MTKPVLRDYQQNVADELMDKWATGVRNALAVMPTGAGKTVLMGNIIDNTSGAICAIAHRQELVGQISMALARYGISHRIIGPNNVVKFCTKQHFDELGKSFYNPNSRVAVAGVDTLIRRGEQLKDWLPTVNMWVIDESHHITKDNKWGIATEMFPNARGLGVTATPLRADGKGLGRHADGVMDAMVVGPSMGDLIDRGFLTKYRIYAPPSTLDLSQVKTSKATGDFNKNDVEKAVKSSSLVSHDKAIVGDIVKHYIKLATGKLGITFVPDLATAQDVADDFNRNGVPAAVVSSKSTDEERVQLVNRFRKRELMQLVNVDLFGEGFDLPAIEVVSMGRPTDSYGLYVQQFGRALRLMDGKDVAIVIDHVGNVHRHGGPPDIVREWSLDRREKRGNSGSGEVPVRTCLNVECMSVYERYLTACPFCGTEIPPPVERNKPEFVDGDLLELTPEALNALYGAVRHNTASVEEYAQRLQNQRAPQIGIMRNVKLHREKLETVEQLRHTLASWCGVERAKGHTDSEIHRKFFIKFGVDVLTPQTWKNQEMKQFNDKVGSELCG